MYTTGKYQNRKNTLLKVLDDPKFENIRSLHKKTCTVAYSTNSNLKKIYVLRDPPGAMNIFEGQTTFWHQILVDAYFIYPWH